MIKYLFFCISAVLPALLYGQDKQPEMNVIYGPRHIYTIATPSGWVNDKDAAKKMELTNLFYNPDDPDDGKRAYMFTRGYDKSSPDENLESFVNKDLKAVLKKYPSAKNKKTEIGFVYPVIDAIMVSYMNLPGRYQEDVILLETAENIVLLKFVTFDKEDYNKYLSKFDQEFLQSFIFRGNDPKPFLEWLENK